MSVDTHILLSGANIISTRYLDVISGHDVETTGHLNAGEVGSHNGPITLRRNCVLVAVTVPESNGQCPEPSTRAGNYTSGNFAIDPTRSGCVYVSIINRSNTYCTADRQYGLSEHEDPKALGSRPIQWPRAFLLMWPGE